ncbi:hypothetical protein CP973_18035 [Streptomyces albofaciens JCM 4342]|uniref:hypothetical protein n=1 Tax=Streptomyces albofaciens TaxID=66866 RepID=UPI0012386E3D|nr:hypothetical protein [Streptomyces albofaciens]KAA6224496.1 hypothetical protein CP973_18035 [Streptomyces albofaciens JCM 4342]
MSSPNGCYAGPSFLAVANPGFEQGEQGWVWDDGTGVDTGHPHTGRCNAYLDAGRERQVRQVVTAAGQGTYDVSAWIAAGGPRGVFQVRVNGTPAGEAAVADRAFYSRHTVSRVALRKGDRMEIVFASGGAWVHVDDVMPSPASPADPRVSSSDPVLVELFAWAKRKANSWVHLAGTVGPLNVDERQPSGSGTAAYAPSYWAGYAHRSGYYARDTAHQVVGAQILGLNEENKTMLGSFAVSAVAAHAYYPVWAYNFDARTYLSIDYHSADSFVREVPAPFELVEKTEQAYRWSGDAFYIDGTMWDFCRHTVTEFVEKHDRLKPNGVAEGTGRGIFQGVASYNEGSGEQLVEAGDAFASQYRAYLAASALAAARGEDGQAARYAGRAAELRRYFHHGWVANQGAAMTRAYDLSGAPLSGWGRENSWFMPMKRLLLPGPRNDAYLDYIDEMAGGAGKPVNIEAITYLPDTFFANDRDQQAWKWMRYVHDHRDDRHPVAAQGINGDYPEVAFTLVSQTVEGLMGFRPDAPRARVTTRSHLPRGIDWVRADHIPVGDGFFDLRHDGTHRSRLTNGTSKAYVWQARFPGDHRAVRTDGRPYECERKTLHGHVHTCVNVRVPPGGTATVEVDRA